MRDRDVWPTPLTPPLCSPVFVKHAREPLSTFMPAIPFTNSSAKTPGMMRSLFCVVGMVFGVARITPRLGGSLRAGGEARLRRVRRRSASFASWRVMRSRNFGGERHPAVAVRGRGESASCSGAARQTRSGFAGARCAPLRDDRAAGPSSRSRYPRSAAVLMPATHSASAPVKAPSASAPSSAGEERPSRAHAFERSALGLLVGGRARRPVRLRGVGLARALRE